MMRSLVSLALSLVAVVGAACTREPGPPNIIYVISDDLGYPYHGFLGDEQVRMPNLDRLARESTVFTTAYAAASVCQPSLEALLTGDEPFRRSGGAPPIVPRVGAETLPGRLAQQGYASLQTGKFWRSDYASSGFTEGTKTHKVKGGAQHWLGGEGLTVGRETMEPVFDFIERHEDGRFFVWFAPMLPHRPWDAPKRFRKALADADPPLSEPTSAYYANIAWFDEVLGELLDFLDERGLRERTLIVYLTDNGYGPRPEDELAGFPWLGAKGTTSELGFRTPLLFHWPGQIPAGVVRDDLVSLLDLFPTILDFAGAPVPDDRPGFDLRPTLAGGPGPRSEIIGHMFAVRVADPNTPRPTRKTRAYYLRDPRWHYVWAPRSDRELLFDIEADPFEQVDRAADFPEVATRLRGRIEAWAATTPTAPVAPLDAERVPGDG